MIVNTVLDALVLSSMYILVALGFALIFSIAGILNFAHGAIYMVGGYVCYIFAIELGLNQWLALIISALIMGLFGLFLERFAFRPFSGDINRTIIMAIAAAITLQTSVNVTIGADVKSIPAFIHGIVHVGAASLSAERILTFVVGGILLLALTFFIRRTKTGQQMLAVSQEPKGAILQGINTKRISAMACAMGCSLAAVAGSLMGAVLQLSPLIGDYMLAKAIQVVILSGIGSIGGILIGGLIIGFIDAVVPLYANGAYAQVIILVIIIFILFLKPQGLFGREV